jgi:hypothetical protein
MILIFGLCGFAEVIAADPAAKVSWICLAKVYLNCLPIKSCSVKE